MSFTTWVRAQDAHGQFDVREGDDLREGVTLIEGYPEHVGLTARPGKPFVDLGVAVAEGYKGLKKQALIDEIDRRNTTAVIGDEILEIPAKPSIATLTKILTDDDEARETAAAAAREAAGIEEPDVTDEAERTELRAQIDERNAAAIAAGEEPRIQVTDGDTVDDLRELLEADDTRTSDADASGTGEDTTTTDAGSGAGSEN